MFWVFEHSPFPPSSIGNIADISPYNVKKYKGNMKKNQTPTYENSGRGPDELHYNGSAYLRIVFSRFSGKVFRIGTVVGNVSGRFAGTYAKRCRLHVIVHDGVNAGRCANGITGIGKSWIILLIRHTIKRSRRRRSRGTIIIDKLRSIERITCDVTSGRPRSSG